MEQLRNHFITIDEPYVEGAVYCLKQKLSKMNFEPKQIAKAVLNITALGLYDVQINNQKVGDHIFAPGFTYYPYEVKAQSYDVTTYVSDESNQLLVYLAQGWYCGRFTYFNKNRIYGEQAAIAWILNIEMQNGENLEFKSDEDVNCFESPYSYAGFYDGENYDGGKEDLEISVPIKRFEGHIPEIISPTQIKVKVQESMTIKSVVESFENKECAILDFGQNFAGFIEIDASLMQSESIRIRHGELLTTQGELYTANLREAKAEILYHKGGKNRVYRPRFTYMGFRYIEVTGTKYVDGLIKAYAIYSEMERTGMFECSNPMVQRLYDNQVWGQKSNYIEVPTDCPQRDERMGYTGDGHVFAKTGCYNFDTELFWDKFLGDIRLSQRDNWEGYIRSTAPASGPEGYGKRSMLGWGNAVTILPELLFYHYGTDVYLKKQYHSMKLFVNAEIRKLDQDGLWISESLGDWLMPEKDDEWMFLHHQPVSNAFIVNDLRILSETAERFGLTDDAAYYRALYNKSTEGYIKRFIDEKGQMTDPYQGAYIMALKFVVTDPALRLNMFAYLKQLILEEGMMTGFFSTEHILPLLVEFGEPELAYDLLLNESCPGWMYQIKRGATTTWERWDALKEDGSVNETKMENGENMVSFNHYAFGSVGAFYYQYILGIKAKEPGFKTMIIQPFFDRRLGSVKGSYTSRYGTTSVEWSSLDVDLKINGYKLTIKVPVPTQLRLPDGSVHEILPGEYCFEVV